jgi:hypothetical protein
MVLASDAGTVGLAVLTGGLAGAIVTGVIGPILADRQGRSEAYRKWQLDLGNEVLTKVAEIRMKLGSGSGAPAGYARAASTPGLHRFDQEKWTQLGVVQTT